MGVSSLRKTVIRQRRDCDLNPGLLRLSPARLPLGCRATHDLPTNYITTQFRIGRRKRPCQKPAHHMRSKLVDVATNQG